MEKYPYWRVLIGFPLLTQLLSALLLHQFGVMIIFNPYQADNALMWFMWFVNVSAVILVTIPTFLLAIVCCLVKFRRDMPQIWQKIAAIMFWIVFFYTFILGALGVGLSGIKVWHDLPFIIAIFTGIVEAVYAAVVLRWILPKSHIAVS